MAKSKKGTYKKRLIEMLEYPSIQKMREYFEAKAGSPEHFKEKSFMNFVKSVMALTEFMGCRNPDSALQNLDEDVLKEYVRHMREKGNATATQKLRFNNIKRWARSNDVDLKWDKVVLPKVRPVVNDRAPTKTELRLIMSYAPIWMIPTTLVLASSGMRVGSLIELRLKHLNLDSFPDIAIIEVPPESAKGGIGYFCAVTLEAREALQKHFTQRVQNGEILSPESPIIKSPKNKGNTTYNAVAHAWKRCLKQSGLTEKSGNFYVLHIQTLRKFFRSQVDGVLTKSIREAMMGHLTTEYLDQSYLRIPETKLAEEYRKTISALTIFEDLQSEEFQRKQLIRQASLLLSPDKLEMLKNIMTGTKDIDEVIREYHRLTRENNGTYEVVTGEEAMLRRLSEGYKLERELNGDKYLLSLS